MTETTSSSSAGDKNTGGKNTGGKSAGGKSAGGKAAGNEGAGHEGTGVTPPVELSTLINDMAAYGKELVDRVSDRASFNAGLVRDRTYDADAWVADVDWFWDNVKKDAVRAAEYWRDKNPAK